MSKMQRRGTATEISSIPPAPYVTTQGKGGRDAEEKYVKACTTLLDKEIRKYPGYHVSMSVNRGVPTFTYVKRTVAEQNLRRRINRALQSVKSGVKNGISNAALMKRIDRALESADVILFDE